MKKTKSLPTLILAISGCLLASTVCVAQTPINLTQDLTVQASGAYAYYARGTAASGAAITPFETMFYPGGSLHGGNAETGLDNGRKDSESTPGPISFGSGYLTDGENAPFVQGWVNIEEIVSGTHGATHDGSFNIVFDLGKTYTITSVVITYQDYSGQRWTTTVGIQKIYTSIEAPSATNAPVLFDSATAVNNAPSGSQLSFVGTAIDARYVTLELVMALGANPNSGASGGRIQEVTIMGYTPVPESSTFAFIGGMSALALGLMKNRLVRK
ncbi:F5/8 type C domain-containing protein [Opitutaceae bacterium TAV1]|nr:F5/8 type C domain-containing protein [Opitutaceae bacterium TAV1]